MISSIVSRERFSLCPYSAAQHPVQCRLQAEVGSNKIAQGTLQSSFSSVSFWRAEPFKEALTIKFVKKVFRTSGSNSHTFVASSYQFPFSAIPWRIALRWPAYQPSGAALSTMLMTFGIFVSGSLSMYLSAAWIAEAKAAFLIVSTTFIMLPPHLTALYSLCSYLILKLLISRFKQMRH